MTPKTLAVRMSRILKTRSLPIWQIAAELGARPQEVLAICITLDVKGLMKQTGDNWTMAPNPAKAQGGHSVFSLAN